MGNNVTFSVGKTMKENTGQKQFILPVSILNSAVVRQGWCDEGRKHISQWYAHSSGRGVGVNGDAPVINWNCGATQPVPVRLCRKIYPPECRICGNFESVQKIKTELVQ